MGRVFSTSGSRHAVMTRWLLCVAVCVLITTSASIPFVSALQFHVLSSEHSISTADGQAITPEAVIASNGGAQNCFLVEMDAAANQGAVSFTYDSNISLAGVRSSLLVSTHAPSRSANGLAVLDDKDGIVEVKTFTQYELKQFNDAADRKEREYVAMERKHAADASNPAPPPFDRDAARLITVNFHAASVPVNRDNARISAGSYAICFTLDSRTIGHQRKDMQLVERATIGLVEISTSQQVHFHSGRRRGVRNNAAQRRVDGVPDDAWNDPKELLRRELAAMEAGGGSGNGADAGGLTSTQLYQKETALENCANILETIVAQTGHLQSRFERMRRTSESTFTRVWVGTACVVAVCLLVVWFTFRYTRNVIVKRKLM